jgi:hypothetical protein
METTVWQRILRSPFESVKFILGRGLGKLNLPSAAKSLIQDRAMEASQTKGEFTLESSIHAD